MDFRELLTDEKPSIAIVLLRIVLRVLSVPYRLVILVRNSLYDCGIKAVHRCSLPVISVGNLSAGGTGKTPAVSWLVRWLQNQDLRVAVLSRGFGELDQGQNDEALELELRHPDVPHLQHWDRVASAQVAEDELDMQVLVLDDAFQHRRIGRDVDLVLLDATDSSAARWMLPGGLYREPVSSLRRADFVILTRTDQARQPELDRLRKLVHRYAPRAGLAEARHRPQGISLEQNAEMDLGVLKGMPILAFCAIGNPQSFFDSLARLGATLLDRKTWPDHHAFSQRDVQSLTDWARSHTEARMVLCTLKDWVKLRLPQIGGMQLGALRIDLEFHAGQLELEQSLARALAGKSSIPEPQ